MCMFDLETYNDQQLPEAYSAVLYDVNRSQDMWYRDITTQKIEIEKESVIVFDRYGGNLIMKILKYFSENYEGDEATYINKEGDEVVSSYRNLLLAHNASGFDSSVELISLKKEINDLKIIGTARGMISLLFRCGIKIVNTVEVSQYVKFTRTP